MGAWTLSVPDPVAFALGPVQIRWYGLAYLAGFGVAWFVLRRLNGRWALGLDADDILEIMLGGVLGVLVGSRVGWVLVYGGADYLRRPLDVLRVWEGGMSFHGGLVGILLAGMVVSRRLGLPFTRLADAGAVGAPVGLFFGRVANFVNGELWGRTSDVPWAVVFPAAGPNPRHPSQLYEALTEGLLLFVIMLLLSRRLRPDGEMLGWFLVLYGVARSSMEFFREPDRALGFVLGPLTTGQLLSLPMIAAGAWVIWRARRRTSKTGGQDVRP